MNILLAFGDGKFIRSKPARFRGEHHPLSGLFFSGLPEITLEKYIAIYIHSKRLSIIKHFSNLFIFLLLYAPCKMHA